MLESFSADLLQAIISYCMESHLESCQISMMELFWENNQWLYHVDYFHWKAPLQIFSLPLTDVFPISTLRTRSSVSNLKKMLVISVYWFAALQQTSTCRRRKFRSIYSKFSIEKNELTPSF